MKDAQLSLTKQLKLQAFKLQVQRLNPEDAQQLLGSLYEEMLVQEALYQELIRKEWGIIDLPETLNDRQEK
jgi:hypothetical protein